MVDLTGWGQRANILQGSIQKDTMNRPTETASFAAVGSARASCMGRIPPLGTP